METFSFGLINSKEVVLLKDYSKDFYFVSDYLTTTRYPKTKEGLILAKQHIMENRMINQEIKNLKR